MKRRERASKRKPANWNVSFIHVSNVWDDVFILYIRVLGSLLLRLFASSPLRLSSSSSLYDRARYLGTTRVELWCTETMRCDASCYDIDCSIPSSERKVSHHAAPTYESVQRWCWCWWCRHQGDASRNNHQKVSVIDCSKAKSEANSTRWGYAKNAFLLSLLSLWYDGGVDLVLSRVLADWKIAVSRWPYHAGPRQKSYSSRNCDQIWRS